jgi:hypothetical protein
MRRYADRLDRANAPMATGLTFTFEPGRGVVVHGAFSYNHDRPGCPLYYIGEDAYMKAHTEVVDRTAWIDPDTGQWRGVAR